MKIPRQAVWVACRGVLMRLLIFLLILQDAVFCHVVFHGGEDIVVFFGLL